MTINFPKSGSLPTAAILCALFIIVSTTSAGTYSGGSGTPQDPYNISSVADWQELIATSADWDMQFILTKHIDFLGMNLTTPVGYYSTAFSGVLDGAGYTIRNFVINSPNDNHMGLFGIISSTGEIRNLVAVDCLIKGRNCVGGLVGKNEGKIILCNTKNTVIGTDYVGGMAGENSSGSIIASYSNDTVSGSEYVGGLAGKNTGAINHCYATGAISGTLGIGSFVGGLVGENNSGSIADCYATGTINGTGSYIGGLAGSSNFCSITGCYATGEICCTGSTVGGLVGYSSQCIITNCYATGTINVPGSFVGGLVGSNYSSSITDCYSTGSVSSNGGSSVGALVGDSWKGKITNCYAKGDVSGYENIGGLVGGNSQCTIKVCFATGAVSGNSYFVGGLVGRNDNCVITSSYATGTVKGSIDYVGGLIGYAEGGGISDSYATSNVRGRGFVGGIAGSIYNGSINICYSAGSIRGTGSYIGGLLGKKNGSGQISNCFWDLNTSNLSSSAGGTGITTAQMKTLSTFTSAGWDFTNIWAICEGTNYPRLKWQIPKTDWICPDGVGMEDLMYLAGRWMAGTPVTAGAADGNGDGRVGIEDFAVIAGEWMK